MPRSRLYRWTLAALGVVSAGVGAVGVFVPGLPTTIFLIIATYCFARSCPWLEERLLRGRLFAPYMKFVDAGEPMPPRAQRAALSAMWLSVGASLAFLFVAGRLEPVVTLLMLTAAAIGTWAIRLAGRRRSSQDAVTES